MYLRLERESTRGTRMWMRYPSAAMAAGIAMDRDLLPVAAPVLRARKPVAYEMSRRLRDIWRSPERDTE